MSFCSVSISSPFRTGKVPCLVLREIVGDHAGAIPALYQPHVGDCRSGVGECGVPWSRHFCPFRFQWPCCLDLPEGPYFRFCFRLALSLLSGFADTFGCFRVQSAGGRLGPSLRFIAPFRNVKRTAGLSQSSWPWVGGVGRVAGQPRRLSGLSQQSWGF